MDSKQGIHIMTLANSIIGVSILAMPYCFKQCGIVLSILLLIFSGILCRLACHFLLKSAIKARLRTFEFLAYHVFGSIGKLFIEIGMIGYLLGTCVAFFVVMGDLSPQIIAQMTETKSLETLRTTILILLALLCVLPLGLLRNVDSLSGVCIATIGFYGVLVVKIFSESVPHLFAGDWYENVDLWRPAGVLQCIPIFSMALFCQTQLFEIYQAIPNASLDKMNDLVRIAVNICTSVYIFVGLFGYVAVSHKPIFSGNILMDFQASNFTEIMKIGFVLSVAFSFPLIIFPCRASLFSLLYKRTYSGLYDSSSHYIPEGKFRILTLIIVTISLVIGILIPNIELVLGLVGSTIGIMICVIFPATCFICLTDKNTNERVLAQLLMLIGITVMVLGTYANLYAIDNVGTNQITALDKFASHQISHEMNININMQDKVVVTPKLHLVGEEIPIKLPDEVKEVRHEPPQPEEPLDGPKEAMTSKLIDITKDKVEANVEKDKILSEPKVEQEKGQLVNEPVALEVDIEAIKKEDRELENENDPAAKANLVEHKKLIEENKKILEEIKMRQEQQQKQLDTVNDVKLKAVKNIEQFAKKAIEIIVDDKKDAAEIELKVENIAADAIQSVIDGKQNEPKQVPNEPIVKIPLLPTITPLKNGLKVPLVPLSYQLGLQNKTDNINNQNLSQQSLKQNDNFIPMVDAPNIIKQDHAARKVEASIADLINFHAQKDDDEKQALEILPKKLQNNTLVSKIKKDEADERKHSENDNLEIRRDILSHDYVRQKRDTDSEKCDKTDPDSKKDLKPIRDY